MKTNAIVLRQELKKFWGLYNECGIIIGIPSNLAVKKLMRISSIKSISMVNAIIPNILSNVKLISNANVNGISNIE